MAVVVVVKRRSKKSAHTERELQGNEEEEGEREKRKEKEKKSHVALSNNNTRDTKTKTSTHPPASPGILRDPPAIGFCDISELESWRISRGCNPRLQHKVDFEEGRPLVPGGPLHPLVSQLHGGVG